MLFGVFKRRPRKVYYEFTQRRPIGPTGDYLDAGIWWTNHVFSPMKAQAARVWYQYHDNTIEEIQPKKRRVDENTATWLGLQAAHCEWADRSFGTHDTGPR